MYYPSDTWLTWRVAAGSQVNPDMKQKLMAGGAKMMGKPHSF